jgi:hypothetical protein
MTHHPTPASGPRRIIRLAPAPADGRTVRRIIRVRPPQTFANLEGSRKDTPRGSPLTFIGEERAPHALTNTTSGPHVKSVCPEALAGEREHSGEQLEPITNGPLARLFWRALDALDYWVTQAGLWVVDAVRGPEPETAVDRQQRGIDRGYGSFGSRGEAAFRASRLSALRSYRNARSSSS